MTLLNKFSTPKHMKLILAGILMSLTAINAQAETENFDSVAVGALPPGWTAGVTGSGSPRWAIETDVTAPSKSHVLKQAGKGTFPWCVKSAVVITDGFVEVKFKPISGKQDQAGGVVWRFKDGDHYYVARANALENNVSLYYTEKGTRKTIKYVDAPVADNVWHLLRAEFLARTIKVSLDGKTHIELDDSHITGSGAVGVWCREVSFLILRSKVL